MMKMLIIGGTSTVGNSIKKSLSGTFDIITAGRKNCDIILDLREPMSKFQLPEELDVIIHTAAQFGVRTDEEILETENINVLGTLKLCQAAVKSKAKHFVFISSIFSSAEKSAFNYNFYSLSKKHAEDVAILYCSKFSLPLTILRPSQLYGNDPGFKIHQPFFFDMIEKASLGQDINLYGTNDPLRNYLHIQDLVDIIERVVRKKIEGSYACSYTADITYSQIATAAFEVFKSGGRVHFLKDKPDIPSFTFEKDPTLYKKIDFYPKISIEEGLKRLVNSRINNN
jgi:nucleoside-diphosphate-sugar epimerase